MPPVSTLILSAGLGTRLAPLSAWRAKPLVPVGDRPAIAAIVARVRDASRVVVVNAHHRTEDVEAYARATGLLVSREATLLGTAGGLANAGDLLGAGDVLVWNGDMIGDLDVRTLLDAHARNAARGAVATLVVRGRADGGGNVGLAPSGDAVRIRLETSRPGESSSADFLGVYVVGAALRPRFPPAGDVVSEVFLPAIRDGECLSVFVTDVPFLDIGTPRAYLDANARWLAHRGRSAWVGEGAVVDAAVTLEGAIVGAGARVRGEGRLERCVVWPGAEAYAPLADAVVASEGVVRVPPAGS